MDIDYEAIAKHHEHLLDNNKIRRFTDKQGCDYHQWEKYTGVTNTFEYCSQCDIKRKWDPFAKVNK